MSNGSISVTSEQMVISKVYMVFVHIITLFFLVLFLCSARGCCYNGDLASDRYDETVELKELKAELVLRDFAKNNTDEYGNTNFELKDGNGRSGPFNMKVWDDIPNGHWMKENIKLKEKIKKMELEKELRKNPC